MKRALALRFARGLRYEARRSRRGTARTHVRVARELGVAPADLARLMNPMRRRAPARDVRVAIERLSARWPHGKIAANEWGKQ